MLGREAGREAHLDPPPLDSYSELPLFNTKAVVHQTGVPAPTLRAWERRYGVLRPQRSENAYRLYSERDIVVVSWLRERIRAGMTISQAIALLKSFDGPRKRARRPTRGVVRDMPGVGLAIAQPAQTLAPDRFAFEDLRASLMQQLTRLDEGAALGTLAHAMTVHSVEDVCLHLVQAVLQDIGALWADGGVSVASVTVEHFASALMRALLGTLFRQAGAQDGGPLVLVGCAPGELHEIGALMLALFLRRAGLRVAYLGQSVEIESLLVTIASVRPAAVLLSATMPVWAEGLIGIEARLRESAAHGPLFGFGGRAFAEEPGLVARVSGVHLGQDAQHAAREVRRSVLG